MSLGLTVGLLACSAEDGPTAADASATGDAGQEAGTDAALDAARPDDATASPTDATPGNDGAAGDAAADTGTPRNYDWAPGDYPPDLHAQVYLELSGLKGQPGKTRGYKVHVPATYSASKPAPVLFALHGYQQNAVMFVVDGTSFVSMSDRDGFILVMPNGLQEDGIGGSWNAGVCCGAASGQRLDDVGFVRAIHAELREHVNVDDTRVYATGLSNGGFMTHRLGCEASDLFAAIAPLAGAVGTKELGAPVTNNDPDLLSCVPKLPIPVLALHGTADGIVPYDRLKLSLDHWAAKNGCASTTLPATIPKSGGDTTCVTYAACPTGVEVTGCSVQNGGHCWFGNESCGTGAPGFGNIVVGNNSTFLNASEAAWAFVSRFRR